MITILRIASVGALAVAVFLLTGCNTVSVNSFQYVGGPAYAPTPADQIQVLRTMPERPLAKLGEITAEPSSDSVTNLKIEQALQKRAAAMGANAVVITSDSLQLTGAFVSGPLFNRSVQRTTGRVITAVAIRYTAN
jgi:hypothetical protein